MDFLKNAKRLPVLDWNLTFFGAHEQKVTDDWHVPAEKHYAFECIYVLSGTERILIRDQTYDITKGSFFLIPPEFTHQIIAVQNLTYFCFHFDIDDPQLKGQLISDMDYYHPAQSPLAKKLRPHLTQLDELVNAPIYDFNTKMIIQIELSKILQLFYISTKPQFHGQSSTSVEYARLIAEFLKNSLTNQVLDYIKNGRILVDHTNLVEQAMKSIGISNGYGFRVFKQTYGVSPRDYLSKMKSNETKKLLMKPQYTIGDISTALGYTNLANFSRQFKRWNSLSPNQWRQQHQN